MASISSSALQEHLPALESALSLGAIKLRFDLCRTPEETRKYSEEIIRNPNNSCIEKGWAYFYLANSSKNENQFDRSLNELNTALELASQAPDNKKDQQLLDQIQFQSTLLKIRTIENYNPEEYFASLQQNAHLEVPERAYTFLYLVQSHINRADLEKAKETFSRFLDLQKRKIPNSYTDLASKIGRFLVGFNRNPLNIRLDFPDSAAQPDFPFTDGHSRSYLRGLERQIKREDATESYKNALSKIDSISKKQNFIDVKVDGKLSIQERIHATIYVAEKCLLPDVQDEDKMFATSALEKLLSPQKKLSQSTANQIRQLLDSIHLSSSSASSKRGRDPDEKKNEERPTKK